MLLLLALIGTVDAWGSRRRSQPSFDSDATQFAEGVGEGLVKNTVGTDGGWTATKDVVAAGHDAYDAVESYRSGNKAPSSPP